MPTTWPAIRAPDEPQLRHLVRVPVIDAVTFLTLWIITLYGLHASLVVRGLGSVGTPARLLSLLAAAWWIMARFIPSLGSDQRFQPIRIAVLTYAAYMLSSFVVANARSLSPLEQAGTIRAVISLVSLSGVALLVADGIHDRERLRLLLRRVTTAAAAMAALGVLQYVSGEPFLFSLPGLEWNISEVPEVDTRQDFNRPGSTALHPIEFGVVLGAMLPLAIHYLVHARDGKERIYSLMKVLVITAGIPLSVSRSAVLSAAVGMTILGLGWTWRQRANAALVFLLAIPVASGLIPGVLDLFLELFTGQDASVEARVNRIPAVLAQFRRRPWVGLGRGTWNLEDWFLLDNQIFVSLLDSGVLGVAVIFGMITSAGLVARSSGRNRSAGPEMRHMGYAVAAGIGGLSISLFTFDAFFYRILTGTLFLLIGTAGALWRLNKPQRQNPPPPR